ncbi:hypothetical protein Tco_1357196 [Tanacetum coccineum]
MDQYTKNALWCYWRRGDDEEVITDNELSNPRDDNSIEENEIAQIFRIDTDIFYFETPLCEASMEFNYLSQIDVDVVIKDIPGFKTYEEYKDDWIYEWNDGIPWVNEKPWNDDGVWTESMDNIYHECNPLRFKNKTAKWLSCNWKKVGYCNTRDLPGFIREGNSICYEDYECDDAWSYNSPINEWKDYEHTAYIETDASSSQNTYNNICQIVMDHNETQEDEGQFDEHELMGDDDDDISDLEDYLIRKDPPYYVNEEEERSKERRCKLLRIPYVKSPTCKSDKFEVSIRRILKHGLDMAYRLPIQI